MSNRAGGFVGRRSALVILVIAGLLASPGAMFADGLILTLAGPPNPVAPGSDPIVVLLAANPGSSGVEFEPPPSIQGLVWQGERSWPVVLRARQGNGAMIAPGGFLSRDYVLSVPAGISGRLILEVSGELPGSLRAVVSVAPAGAGAATLEPPAAAVVAGRGVRTTVSTIPRGFVGHFSMHEPIYFVYGPKAPAAKFQFSFKYRLLSFDPDSPEAPKQTLQFAYTQRSLWDVNASSSPFYDTSYMPALFYQFLTLAPDPNASRGGPTWLGFQSGYQHESNGQGSVQSRSLNTMFVRTGYLFGRPEGWHAIVMVRVLDYVGGLSDNPDLENYRGYGDWQVAVARGDGPSLSYTGRAGKDLNHFTSEFDLNFPIRTRLLDFGTYFIVQYFDGYGESLRSYDKPSNIVRAGISLVR